MHTIPTVFSPLNAALPECLPSTSELFVSPTLSGVIISYVDAFFSMPSWWIPDSCAKALAPTMALLGCSRAIWHKESRVESVSTHDGLVRLYNESVSVATTIQERQVAGKKSRYFCNNAPSKYTWDLYSTVDSGPSVGFEHSIPTYT